MASWAASEKSVEPPAGDTPKNRDDGPKKCEFCKDMFRNEDVLRHHKAVMLEREAAEARPIKHIYCVICDVGFKTLEAGKLHHAQNHGQKQNISCPGCGMHFQKFSGFVKHIECEECPNITQQNAEDRCRKSLDFARGLALLDAQAIGDAASKAPKDFGIYLNHEPPPLEPVFFTVGKTSPWGEQPPDTWDSLDPVAPTSSDFPRMSHHEYLRGNSNIPDLLTGDDNDPLEGKPFDNPWATGKNLFPDASPAQNSTTEQLQSLEAVQRSNMVRAKNHKELDYDHPNSPYFDAQRYWSEFTRKFKCPRDRCKKAFADKGGLIQHLRSPTHSFGKNFTCPSCKDRFGTLFALAAHAESASQKCGIRHADFFEVFLSQLTWNLVEVTGKHAEDGTAKYDISQQAKEAYGVVGSSRTTFGHHQVYGSQTQTVDGKSNAAGNSRRGLRAGALAKHQQSRAHGSRGVAGKAIAAETCHGGLTLGAAAQNQQKIKDERLQKETVQQKQQQNDGNAGIVALTAEALSKLDLLQRQELVAPDQGKQQQNHEAEADW